MKRVLLIVEYFGAWPAWFDLFLASCAANPTIDWLIVTDCRLPARTPPNVRWRQRSFREHCVQVSRTLGIEFSPAAKENLGNLRPAYGELHAADIDGYDAFGWCDVDVVFGDLRRWLTDAVLDHGLVASSDRICTGHLCVLRNEPRWRQVHRDIPDWRRLMSRVERTRWRDSVDEAWLSRLCSPHPAFRQEAAQAGVPAPLLDRHRHGNCFEEQWSTPFAPGAWHDGQALHPEAWYWQAGVLRNWRDGERTFPYLHLMNYKAHRYIDARLYGAQPTWQVSMLRSPALLQGEVIRIDRAGLHALDAAQARAECARLRQQHEAAAGVASDPGAPPMQEIARFRDLGARLTPHGLLDPAGVIAAPLRARLWDSLLAPD